MIDNFMKVLEEFSDANLYSVGARRRIAEALINHMCDHHIVTYTDLESARKDPAMVEFIKNCGCKTTDDDQMDLPFERGL